MLCHHNTPLATLLKEKNKYNSAIALGYMQMKKNNFIAKCRRIIRILIYYGSTRSVMHHLFAKKLKSKEDKTTKWVTKAKGGNFTTSKKCEFDISLPALHPKRLINWGYYADNGPLRV